MKTSSGACIYEHFVRMESVGCAQKQSHINSVVDFFSIIGFAWQCLGSVPHQSRSVIDYHEASREDGFYVSRLFGILRPSVRL